MIAGCLIDRRLPREPLAMMPPAAAASRRRSGPFPGRAPGEKASVKRLRRPAEPELSHDAATSSSAARRRICTAHGRPRRGIAAPGKMRPAQIPCAIFFLSY